jgi:o-succinylbenzoate synthase
MRASLQLLHTSTETVRNAKRAWTSRSSLRLILEDDRGLIGLGEAAPLPGVSRDDIAQVRDALEGARWPERTPTSLEEVTALVETIDPALPSARFAAETALASMAACRRGEPLWALFADEVEEVGVASALFSSDADQLEAMLAEAAAFDVPAVKLKVGLAPETEEARLERVRRALPEIELRLDANRSLDVETLPEQLARLRRFDPAFLEEPAPLEATLALPESPVPLAVDESLDEDPDGCLARVVASDLYRVVVLKPTVLGGLLRCWKLAQRARAKGRAVVISHAFEGVIARAASAHLALAVGGEAAGLGEHPALDLLSDGLIAPWIDVGWIEPPDLPGLGLDVAW